MMKHAFLIMAHNNLEILQTLVSMLDDERNDIFLHIDLKSNMLANHPMSTSKARLLFWNIGWMCVGVISVKFELNMLCLKRL